MMRLHRASVITALCVLTQVATAYAECAWVVWATREAPAGESYSFPVQANKTREAYEARMWSAIAPAVQQGVARREGEGSVLVYKDGKPQRSDASPTPWTRAGRRGSERFN